MGRIQAALYLTVRPMSLCAEKHRLYKAALRWKQRVTIGQQQNDDEENHSYLITVPEETGTRCNAMLNDMDQTRREIHLKQGSDMSEIFGYYKTLLSKDNDGEETEQVTLGVTEDRRENTSQFDLAYVDVSGQEV